MENNSSEFDSKRITKILLKWFDKNGRFLPWRKVLKSKKNPYHVWISEIMLQQTTVNAVIPRFKSFIRRWPNIKNLSLATIDEVLHEWQGLGYYSRAHNIHKTAKIIIKDFDGKLPKNSISLKKLPGIGEYTSGAVASIAFLEPILPVDVNIQRVLARVKGIYLKEKKFKSKIRDFACSFVEENRPGDLTEAFMDLGAGICKPSNPQCMSCPISKYCISFKENIMHEVPGKLSSKVRKKKYGVVFFVINQRDEILLRKRIDQNIFNGMMELPMTPLSRKVWTTNSLVDHYPVEGEWLDKKLFYQGPISDFELNLNILFAKIITRKKVGWFPLEKIDNYALPSVFKKIIGLVEKNFLK